MVRAPRSLFLVLALCGDVATAAAQPGGDPPAPDAPDAPTEDPAAVAPDAQPPVDDEPPIAAPSRAPAAAVAVPPPPAPSRTPTGTTVGIGIGSRQPGSLSSLNVGSIRIRLGSGLSIEPNVVVARSSADSGDGGTITTTASELSAGVAMRFPVARRGAVELLGVGSLGMTSLSSESGDEFNMQGSSSTSVSLAWGLAIDYWLQRHWAVSLSATNPLVTHNSETQSFGGMDQPERTSTTYGLLLDPTITAMVHLFY